MNSIVLIQNIFCVSAVEGCTIWRKFTKKIQKKTFTKKYNIAFYKKIKRKLSSSEKSAQSGNWSHRRSMLMQAPEEATRSCSLCFPFMLEYNMEDNVILVIMMVLLTMATMIVMRR